MEELTIVPPEMDDPTLSYALSEVDATIESRPRLNHAISLINVGRPRNHVAVLEDSRPGIGALNHLTSATILDGIETIARFDADEDSRVVVEISPDLAASAEAIEVDEVVGVGELLRAVVDSHGCFLSLAIA